MSLACIHSSLQLRTCPGVSLRRSLSCTNAPGPFLFPISFLRQELTRFGRSRKTFWRQSWIPVVHDLLTTTSGSFKTISATQGGIRAHLSPPIVVFGFRFSFAGTASLSEGKYCRRRIRVEDDDASVTNFIPQDWRQFRCDILYHSSSEHCTLFHCLYKWYYRKSIQLFVPNCLSFSIQIDRPLGSLVQTSLFRRPSLIICSLSSSIRSHMRLHTGPLPMTICDTCGILKRH